MVHRLGTEKLSDTRAQDGKTVCISRVSRRTGTFELEHPALTISIDHFTEIDRSSVSKLPCPMPELMASITHRKRLHWFEQLASGKCIEEPIR